MRHDIERLFPQHYAGQKRHQGGADVLKGDVLVLTIFVDDAASRWTDDLVQRHEDTYFEGLTKLQAQADAFHVPLEMRFASCRVSVDVTCKGHGFAAAIPAILQAFGCEKVSQLQRQIREEYHCEEVGVIFALNRPMWPWALAASTLYPLTEEYALLDDRCNANTFVHELLHLFGAVDLFYPEEALTASGRYLPGSIMNGGWDVDPLTRYLIGWSEELNDKAMQFLRATKEITYKRYLEALDRYWDKLPTFE